MIAGDFVAPPRADRSRGRCPTTSRSGCVSRVHRCRSAAATSRLWTKYDGWDPEVSGADGLNNQYRADIYTLPQVRRMFARLNLQF